MNLDNTFIYLFGFKFFEPVAVFTNLLIVFFSLFAYFKLWQNTHQVIKNWAMFFLLLGLSSALGSLCHGIQRQLGDLFLNVSWFFMNVVALVSIYFFYQAASRYNLAGKKPLSPLVRQLTLSWIFLLIILTAVFNNFLLIKINAAMALIYSMVVHYSTYKKHQAGSVYIFTGIIISFLSFIIHGFKLSIHDWFNYKDISHIIMLTSLFLMYLGVQTKINSNPSLFGNTTKAEALGVEVL